MISGNTNYNAIDPFNNPYAIVYPNRESVKYQGEYETEKPRKASLVRPHFEEITEEEEDLDLLIDVVYTVFDQSEQDYDI